MIKKHGIYIYAKTHFKYKYACKMIVRGIEKHIPNKWKQQSGKKMEEKMGRSPASPQIHQKLIKI